MVDATDAPSFIGVARARVDSEEKVRGATRYAADQRQPGLLHARIVPSVYAHARIRSIDASAALAMPGVVAVLTAADLPIATVEDMRMFEPLAREEALFVGHPIALVIAETETAAADAVAEVYVDAERLPVVTDLEAAMLPGGPLARITSILPVGEAGEENTAKSAHAAVGSEGAELLDEDLSDNVHNRKRYVSGDSAAALAGSAVTAEGTFLTNWVYQGYMEPHASTAWIESDGVLTVSTSTQGIFYVRKQLAKIFGRPMNKVRVRAAPLGGSFGSKVVLVDPLAAGAALALRRPVRVAFDRREDMAGTNPAPGSRIDVRIGATADGTLTGLDARLVFDTGAYIEWSIEGIAAVLIGGAYRWSAFDVRAYGVRTNRFGTGSYRGPGGPQAAFALESLIDELANKLGIDAIELRTRNLVAEGDQMVDGEPWPGLGHAAVLEAVRTHPLWQGRHDLPPDEGVGVAFGVWPGGKAPAAALCRLNADGSITITTGVVDMSGTTGAFQVIAAETFGIDPSRVEVVALDTDGAPAVAAERWQRHHLFVGPGDPRGGGRCPAPDAGLRRARDGDRPGRPRDRRRRHPARRIAGSGPADRRVRRGPPRLQQRVPADRGPRLDRPGQPRSRRPPRTSRTSAWIPRPATSRSSATSSRRTSGVRSTRLSSRARCAVRPPRASAGPCTRS